MFLNFRPLWHQWISDSSFRFQDMAFRHFCDGIAGMCILVVGGQTEVKEGAQMATSHSNAVTRFRLWRHVTALVIPTESVTHQISEKCDTPNKWKSVTHQISEGKRTCAKQSNVISIPCRGFFCLHLLCSHFGFCSTCLLCLPFITYPHWGTPY